jgi:hypothetical protein
MGHGGYSYAAHQAITSARANLDAQQVFTQTGVHPLMNPHGVRFRECRDSAEHPEALAICFALDISGSMGDIPDLLARKELPKFMKTLMSCAVAHPQLLFMAFADARCESEPRERGEFHLVTTSPGHGQHRPCTRAHDAVTEHGHHMSGDRGSESPERFGGCG